MLFAQSGTADAASTKRVTLGKGNMSFQPNCGRSSNRGCIAEGKVTGFQSLSRRSAGRNFVVPWNGKIISWSIRLSNPTASEKRDENGNITQFNERAVYNDVFGSPSQARISVLRQVEKNKKGPPRFRLVRQSPVQVLNPYFGSTVQFALTEPLNVLKGQVVALTIPTWAPVIWRPKACDDMTSPACADMTGRFTWRGSRGPGKCELARNPDTGEPNDALASTRPQQKVGSVKRYGCYYDTPNVLVYSATIVGRG